MRIIYYDGKETRQTGFADNINGLKLVFPVSNLIPDDHLHLCAVHGAIYYHETKIDGKEHFFYHWNFLSLQKEINDKLNPKSDKENIMKVMSGCKFKKGFMIQITSWENDADHYSSQIIDGLTKEEVNQFSYVMPFFKSRNSKSKGFGNKDFCMFSVEEVLMEGLDEGKLTREFLGKFFFEDGHPDLDKIHDLLGQPVEYDYDFIRVFESMKIYHLPEDVVIPEFNPELISEM